MFKISVCMATYNGEKYIKEQIESILFQSHQVDEIIISDDNSIDRTLEIVAEFNDPRIAIIKNEGSGILENFENALKKCSGEYIFLSDQDDIWDYEKVRVCMEDFEKGYDLVLSDCSMFDSETNVEFQDSYFNFIGSKKGIIFNILKNSYIGCCMAFRLNVKRKILPFPKNIPMHDSWIGILAEIYFNVNFNEKKLIKYRKHSQNASDTSTGKSSSSFLKKIEIRLLLSYNLLKRVLKNEL